jgi:hypothetical protein
MSVPLKTELITHFPRGGGTPHPAGPQGASAWDKEAQAVGRGKPGKAEYCVGLASLVNQAGLGYRDDLQGFGTLYVFESVSIS